MIPQAARKPLTAGRLMSLSLLTDRLLDHLDASDILDILKLTVVTG